MADGHLHAARVGQFLSVNFRAHAPLGTGLQDAGGVVGGEEALVAEHVDEVGQPLTTHLGNHLVDDQPHVLLLRHAACHGVRPEEGGLHAERCRLADVADDAQHLQLVGGVQTVAALYFHGSRPLADYLVDALHGLSVQFVFAQLVQTVGTVQDASATACNLGIAQSANLVDELPLAAAGIDQMGVRVAERGQHGTALGIDDGLGPRGGAFPKVLHASVLHQQPGVFQYFCLRHLLPSQALVPLAVNHQQPNILDK